MIVNQYRAFPALLGTRLAAIEPSSAKGIRIGMSCASESIGCIQVMRLDVTHKAKGSCNSFRFIPSRPSIQRDQMTKIQVGHVNHGRMDMG